MMDPRHTDKASSSLADAAISPQQRKRGEDASLLDYAAAGHVPASLPAAAMEAAPRPAGASSEKQGGQARARGGWLPSWGAKPSSPRDGSMPHPTSSPASAPPRLSDGDAALLAFAEMDRRK